MRTVVPALAGHNARMLTPHPRRRLTRRMRAVKFISAESTKTRLRAPFTLACIRIRRLCCKEASRTRSCIHTSSCVNIRKHVSEKANDKETRRCPG